MKRPMTCNRIGKGEERRALLPTDGHDGTPSLYHGPQTSTDQPHETAEGGLQAWLVVAGAFFVWFNSWGAINAFGAFQTYYQLDLLSTYSPSHIAWIGSMQNTLVLAVGFLSGPLHDAGYTRLLLCSGAILTVGGFVTLSFAEHGHYYHIFLSQAICMGLVWGLMFTPAANLPSRFFKKQLPLAAGLASAGTGVGGLVYSSLFSRVVQIRSAGYPWAVRSLALLAFVTLAFSLITMSVKSEPALPRRFIDWTAFHETRYTIYLIGGVFTMIGIQAPYYYASLYAIDTGMISVGMGSSVVAAINSGSVFGRLIPPFVALRAGVFDTFVLCYIATSASCFGFVFSCTGVSVLTMGALYGFFSGAIVALSPVTIMKMTPDPELVGARMGMAFAIPSMGVLIGSPVCGAILASTASYSNVWIFSGSCIAVGAMLMTTCRIVMTRGVLFEHV